MAKGNAAKRKDYCGMTYAEDLGYEIPCFHRKGESCADCLERISQSHRKGKGKSTPNQTAESQS
jgi:hypothetical protein